MNEGLDPTDGTWIPVLQKYAIWVLDGQTEEGLRRKVERLSEEIALNPVDAHFLLHRAIAYGNLDELTRRCRITTMLSGYALTTPWFTTQRALRSWTKEN